MAILTYNIAIPGSGLLVPGSGFWLFCTTTTTTTNTNTNTHHTVTVKLS
jgi:hypothetical protein